MCVCVCVRERERERADRHVCESMCVCVHAYEFVLCVWERERESVCARMLRKVSLDKILNCRNATCMGVYALRIISPNRILHCRNTFLVICVCETA